MGRRRSSSPLVLPRRSLHTGSLVLLSLEGILSHQWSLVLQPLRSNSTSRGTSSVLVRISLQNLTFYLTYPVLTDITLSPQFEKVKTETFDLVSIFYHRLSPMTCSIPRQTFYSL